MSADTIQAITSVINLIIVVLFFIIERKSLVRAWRQDRKENWYHETLLNRGVEIIERCFEEMEIQIEEADSLFPFNTKEAEKQIKKVINDIQKQIAIMKRFLNVYTKLFDESLTKKIKKEIEKMEDIVLSEIERNYIGKTHMQGVSYDLARSKYEILNSLYQFDTDRKK